MPSYCAFCKNIAENYVQFKCDKCADDFVHPCIDVCHWCMVLLMESSHAAYRVGNLMPPRRPMEHAAALEEIDRILAKGRSS